MTDAERAGSLRFPAFLWRLVALMNIMRLCLRRAAIRQVAPTRTSASFLMNPLNICDYTSTMRPHGLAQNLDGSRSVR